MSDREKIVKILTILSDLYRRELSPATVQVYIAVLSRYPIQRVIDVAHAGVSLWTFFPMPSEFVKLLDPPKDLKVSAILAWEIFEDKLRLAGPYRSVTFADPAIAHTINNFGGWEQIYQDYYAASQLSYFRHKWEDVYQVFAGKSELQNFRLMGSMERINRAEGRYIVGDKLRLDSGDIIATDFGDAPPVDEPKQLENSMQGNEQIQALIQNIGKL